MNDHTREDETSSKLGQPWWGEKLPYMRDELTEENTRRERWEKWCVHVQIRTMIELTRDGWILNLYLD